jgi:hypothetical protein
MFVFLGEGTTLRGAIIAIFSLGVQVQYPKIQAKWGTIFAILAGGNYKGRATSRRGGVWLKH